MNLFELIHNSFEQNSNISNSCFDISDLRRSLLNCICDDFSVADTKSLVIYRLMIYLIIRTGDLSLQLFWGQFFISHEILKNIWFLMYVLVMLYILKNHKKTIGPTLPNSSLYGRIPPSHHQELWTKILFETEACHLYHHHVWKQKANLSQKCLLTHLWTELYYQHPFGKRVKRRKKDSPGRKWPAEYLARS